MELKWELIQKKLLGFIFSLYKLNIRKNKIPQFQRYTSNNIKNIF